MSRTAMETVKEFYSLINSDPSALPSVLHSEIKWEIIGGFPYGGEYNGLGSAMEDFFGKVMQHFEFWNDHPDEYIDAGDKIIVLGHYKTRAKGANSDVMPSFAHVWTVDDGMLTRLQQYTDTVVLSDALGHNVPH
ncbi:MAG: nuclear transport factor 2 family protein [Deltaproteobacteria bacterium]